MKCLSSGYAADVFSLGRRMCVWSMKLNSIDNLWTIFTDKCIIVA